MYYRLLIAILTFSTSSCFVGEQAGQGEGIALKKRGDKNVTLSKVRMIVSKFHKNRFSDDVILSFCNIAKNIRNYVITEPIFMKF